MITLVEILGQTLTVVAVGGVIMLISAIVQYLLDKGDDNED